MTTESRYDVLFCDHCGYESYREDLTKVKYIEDNELWCGGCLGSDAEYKIVEDMS
jgi:hypothetical protein